jgi:hypothetical protein
MHPIETPFTLVSQKKVAKLKPIFHKKSVSMDLKTSRRPAVVIDVTLNQKQHELVVFENVNTSGETVLNDSEALELFCAKHLVTGDKKFKL